MNRAHKYTRQRCPRYQDGQAWLAAKITKRHEFFVPALSVGTPRVQVSRKFWCRLFDVQDVALQTLQGVTATPNPARSLASNTGRHNSHHQMSQGLKDCIEAVVVKFLAAAEDHYVLQERVASRWLNFGEGVTWRILSEQVLAEYQPAFGVQSKALGGYLWGYHQKTRRPTAAEYEALGGRVRAETSYQKCTSYIQRTWRVRLKPNVVDRCEDCATLEHKKKKKKLGILQQAMAVPAVASRGEPVVAPAEGGAAAGSSVVHVFRLEDAGGSGSGGAAAAADDDNDDAEEEGPDSDDDDDDDDDEQEARASGGGSGGGAKAVGLPRARTRIGRVVVPGSWKDGDVLRRVGADGVLLNLTPSGVVRPGQLVTFELP